MHDMATKAIYNNILFHSQDQIEASLDYEDWMIRDWRSVPLDLLFIELCNELTFPLDKSLFLSWAHESDSPEELLLLLYPDASEDEEIEEITEERENRIDHIYLLLFELWRRFLPERRSISIIADDIDHLIIQYNSSAIDAEESIQLNCSQKIIKLLLEYARTMQLSLDHIQEKADGENDIVMEETGTSSVPHAIFAMTQPFFVHDISRFIFDFVIDELHEEEQHDLHQVVESLSPFIIPPVWSICMQAHVVAYDNKERALFLARDAFRQLFPSSKEKKKEGYIDIPGIVSILLLAAKIGNKSLFQATLKNMLDQIHSFQSEDLFELVSIAMLYTEVTDHPILSQISALLDEIESTHHTAPLTANEYSSIEHFSRTILRKLLDS